MTRALIGNLRTGRRILDLPFSSLSWERRRNQPETLSATVQLTDPDVFALGLRNAATPVQSFLAILEGDTFVGAGPIWAHSYDKDTGQLTLDASGIWSWLNHRTVLPVAAATIDPALFTVPDPADPTKTMANPALRTSRAGLSLGSIVRELVAQTRTWPGGDLPIVLPAVEAGAHERTYEGPDFKLVAEAIEDITKVERGPDVEFDPRFMADSLGVEWVLRTGSTAQPQLRSTSVHRWDLSVRDSSTRGLSVKVDGSNMTDLAWLTGGRQEDTVLVERYSGNALVAAGYPLLETVDTSHTSVSESSTLRSYAAEYGRLGRLPGEQWSFEVRKDGAPFFGQYSIGDLCKLIIRDDPYIPDGDYIREIAGMSGNEGDWVKITTTESYG